MSSPVAVLRWGRLALAGGLACWSVLALAPLINSSQTAQATSTADVAQPIGDGEPKATPPVSEALPLSQWSREIASLAARQDELLQSLASVRRSLARQQVDDSLERRVAGVVEAQLARQRPESPSISREELIAHWTQQSEHHTRLQRLVTDLQAEVSRLSEAMSQPAVATLAAPRPVLTTKLYRPLRLRADALAPLVQTLLTPEIGLWAAVTLPGEERDAILICDEPDVIAQVDRLIAELDQPLPGLEFEFAMQELDATNGRPLSLAIPLPRELFLDEGNSLIVPESVWQQLSPTDRTSTSTQEASLRVLRVTPRLVR